MRPHELSYSVVSESVVVFVLYSAETAGERPGVETRSPNQKDYIKTRCYVAVMSCHTRVWAACLKCKGVFLKAMCSHLQPNHLLINDFPFQYSLLYSSSVQPTVTKHCKTFHFTFNDSFLHFYNLIKGSLCCEIILISADILYSNTLLKAFS